MVDSGGTVEPDDEEPFVLDEEFRPYFSDEPLPAHLLPVTGGSVRVDAEVLRDYVENMEASVCEEWHGGAWPDCDSPDHRQGRAYLSLLPQSGRGQ